MATDPTPIRLLSADKPQALPEQDRLGYAPFAQHLAVSIVTMLPAEGLVIAIYARWGSGKSTLLNFIEHYLDKTGGNSPVIVRFNPWWFSGDEALVRHFFDHLEAALPASKSKKTQELKNKVAGYAEAVGQFPVTKLLSALTHATTGVPIETVLKGLGNVLKEPTKNVVPLKQELATLLKDYGRKILVVIDDIDRLPADEIRQLFKLIKAVADFPNVIYLLAFDKQAVLPALTTVQGISGGNYLEKIVQVPFDMPMPSRSALRGLLFEQLDLVLGEDAGDDFDQARWQELYLDGIDPFIQTPRDIVRLVNCLSVTYPAVRGEVNPIDFIALECIRVFLPTLYATIRDNPAFFAGAGTTESGQSRQAQNDVLKAFHEDYLKELSAAVHEPVKHLLTCLFQKTQSIWNPGFFSMERATQWRRDLRVCSPEIFPVYFRLAVPEGAITNARMQAVLKLVNDTLAFANALLDWSAERRSDGSTQARAILERLEDYTEERLPISAVRPILTALANVSDDLIAAEPGRRGILDMGIDMRIGRLYWQLLSRLSSEERFSLLEDIVANGRAIQAIVYQVAVFGQEQGKFGGRANKPAEMWLLTADQLTQLEAIVLERIRRDAKSGVLLGYRDLPRLLHTWAEWCNAEEPRAWMQQTATSDDNLLAILEKFLGETITETLEGYPRTYKTPHMDPEHLRPFLDLKDIIKRVRQFATREDLPDRQRLAVQQFITEYDARQQDINPASPPDETPQDTQ